MRRQQLAVAAIHVAQQRLADGALALHPKQFRGGDVELDEDTLIVERREAERRMIVEGEIAIDDLLQLRGALHQAWRVCRHRALERSGAVRPFQRHGLAQF